MPYITYDEHIVYRDNVYYNSFPSYEQAEEIAYAMCQQESNKDISIFIKQVYGPGISKPYKNGVRGEWIADYDLLFRDSNSEDFAEKIVEATLQISDYITVRGELIKKYGNNRGVIITKTGSRFSGRIISKD